MSELLPSSAGPVTTASAAALPAAPAVAVAERKGLDLAVVRKGAKDYLDFLDATKEVFYAYLYHRTGSEQLAKTLLSEIFLDVLSRAMSLWWFGTLSIKLLLETADRALKDREVGEADLDTVYLPTLSWLSDDEKKQVSTFHDALWTLPHSGQQFIILSYLIGLSDERLAEIYREPLDMVQEKLKTAKEFLLSRWQPSGTIVDKLQSLVFVPSLDLQAETKLRFSVVEKYNALRFRKYQWVIIGGLFAVMSNVIVASVLAFAVVTEPPSSLRGIRTQVASLDAVLVEREMNLNRAKGSIAAQFKESQRIAAFDVSRDLTSLGLAAALESLKQQQDQEKEVNRLIKVMQRASTAAAPAFMPIAKIAMSFTNIL